MSQIQERMKKLGIKQVDMILELRKRGIAVQPPEMSSIIRGVYTYPNEKIWFPIRKDSLSGELQTGYRQRFKAQEETQSG